MGTSERRPTPPPAWLLRGTWFALPLLMGPAVTEALEGWARAPRSTAEALLWAGWGAGLVAVLAPRPLGLTVLRVAGAAAVGAAVASIGHAEAVDAGGALTSSGLVAALTTLPVVAEWFANGSAYGLERRFPLRHPPVIRFLAGPLAALTIAAALAVPLLLLASGRVLGGLGSLALGAPALVFLWRSLHALSRRWLVSVPGGVVVHDPLTVADPVLIPAASIASIEPVRWQSINALDLRLGVGDGLSIVAAPPVMIPVRQGRRRAGLVEASNLLVAPAQPGAMLRTLSLGLRPER